jgi:MFS family permease
VVRTDDPRSLEWRLYVHALSGRAFFYIPVLVLHIRLRLEAAGTPQANAVTMTTLALFALGIAVAEYPSGVFADWAGRARSLVVGSFLYALGVGILWWEGPIWALALSQLMLGVASAFRSGADTALLYSHLSRQGALGRYPAALARLRFANLLGLTLAAGVGGVLWQWHPPFVFAATIAAVLLGTLPLVGIGEVREAPAHAHYWGVMRASLAEIRRNRGAQLLVLLGGTGATYFVFAYWAVQAFLVGFDTSPLLLGQLTMLVTLLQAATMPLSSWLAHRHERYTGLLGWLLLAVTAAFGAVALAARLGLPWLGAGALVAAAGCAPLFRNLVNIRLQPLVSDGIRASMVSLETWLGALYYALFFPVAGWLLDVAGASRGYAWIAAAVAVTSVPLLVLTRRERL